MEMKKYKSYGTDEVPQAMITLTSLEAGGFHPVFLNYDHNVDNQLPAMSNQGLTLMLPSNELKTAATYLHHQEQSMTQDFDPIVKPRLGVWRYIIMALISPLFISPIISLLLYPSWEVFARVSLFYIIIGLPVWLMIRHARGIKQRE